MEPVTSPFLQTDYRRILREDFESKQRINHRFSSRRFAQIVGFKSPNYLQLVLEGKRNLSEDSGLRIAKALRWSPAQRDVFLALIRAESAANEADRAQAESLRLVAVKRLLAKEVPAAQREVLSHWHHLMVRECFLLKNARPDVAWIHERLGGLITPEEIRESIECLLRSGLLVRRGESYAAADPVLDTNEAEFQAAAMRDFHAGLLKAWARSLGQLGPDTQELGVLNIPISRHRIPELKERIRRFQDEIIGWVQDETDADQLVQLGTYLIPFPADDGGGAP